jgi:hypothetical protein
MRPYATPCYAKVYLTVLAVLGTNIALVPAFRVRCVAHD